MCGERSWWDVVVQGFVSLIYRTVLYDIHRQARHGSIFPVCEIIAF